MSSNQLDQEDEFRNSRKGKGRSVTPKKDTKFKRPSKITKDASDGLGTNPFKAKWSFPGSLSFDRFIPQTDEGSKNSKSVYAANLEEIEDIKAGRFTPFFLEKGHIRIHLHKNQGFRKTLFGLEPSCHKLLWWIVFHLEPGKDYLLLNRQQLITTDKILSKDTFYKVRKALIEAEIIAKTKIDDYYWFNCQLFFYGNRTSYYPEHVVVKQFDDLSEIKLAFLEQVSARLENRAKQLSQKGGESKNNNTENETF